MAVITIGDDAINRNNNTFRMPNTTFLSANSPADGTGTIDTVEIYIHGGFDTATGIRIGTFFGSGTSWTLRDSESVGERIGGFEQFTGLNLDVEEGDIIGIYWASGSAELEMTRGGTMLYKSGDQFDQGTQTYGTEDSILSLQGTGTTTAPEVTNPKIKIGGTFSTKTIKTKISNTFTEKPLMVKVGGAFQ